MVRFETAFAALLLVIFAVMTALAFTFPPDARFLPLVAGVPGTILCAVQLGIELRQRRRPVAVRDDTAPPVAAELRHAAWFGGYVGLVLLVGFVIASPVLVFLYLWREAGVRPVRAGLAAAAFAVWIEVMFERLLGFALHPGLWGGPILGAVGLG